MQLRVVDDNSIGTGLRVDLAADSHLFLAEGVTVARTDGTVWSDSAISSTGSNQKVDIYGTVLAMSLAMSIGDTDGDSGNIVSIHEDALIRSYGDAAVRMMGRNLDFENDGTILARSQGLIIGTYGTDTSTVVNRGSIESTDGIAVGTYGTSDGKLTLQNYGEISGVWSYNGAGYYATDTILNFGLMKGDIVLYAGNDVYDGRKGVVDGTVFGGDGNDTLRGGRKTEILEGDYGSDSLFGGAGNDRLAGGNHRDTLWGEKGSDVFAFDDIEESMATKNGSDIIMDFSQRQKDRIDLSFIDAIPDPPVEIRRLADGNGDQPFTFIGTEKFHKLEGELRFFQKEGETIVQADTDGNGKADFQIRLEGAFTLTADDFML